MNEDLKLTPEGIKLIQHFESCLHPHEGKFKSYVCPAGVRTIGWGSTGPPHGKHKIDAATVWTRRQCDEAFASDMQEFEKSVRSAVTVALSANEYSALVSFTYNCGQGALRGSTLLRKLNAGDRKGASAEFPKWNKAGGKVSNGLVRRRASERIMFDGGQDQNFDGKADPMPQAVDEPDEAAAG